MTEEMLTVYCRPCSFCGTQYIVDLPAEKVKRWRDGEHIQNVFPEMSPDEREILISGTCSECWDKYMKNWDM
jgi:hypothetical protein